MVPSNHMISSSTCTIINYCKPLTSTTFPIHCVFHCVAHTGPRPWLAADTIFSCWSNFYEWICIVCDASSISLWDALIKGLQWLIYDCVYCLCWIFIITITDQALYWWHKKYFNIRQNIILKFVCHFDCCAKPKYHTLFEVNHSFFCFLHNHVLSKYHRHLS